MIYITFGQDHKHEINGTIIDKDIVVEVVDRSEAFELFGYKFATTYCRYELELEYYPRGILKRHNR